MLVHATPTQARAIVRAMGGVATGHGVDALSAVDAMAIESCHHVMLYQPEPLDVAALLPITPSELAALVSGSDVGEHAVQLLAVIALVDGTVRAERIDTVARFAEALGLREDYLDELVAAAEGKLQWAIADMSRHNVVSISDGRLHPEDFALLPVNEAFTCPHDSTHLLSGYSTSPQGELLVSTFTAGMHPLEPMAGHILPVIFSWHLGIELNPVAGKWTDAFHPQKFWVAWERGAKTTGDPFAADWNFWALTETALEDLKRRFRILPLEPGDAAAADRPEGFKPIE